MNVNQMYARCDNPTFLSTGYLEDYKLVFDGYSNTRNSLVANIIEQRHSKLPYVLWLIDEQDELLLDKSEGFPKHYEKIILLLNDGVEATTYLMTEYKKSLKTDKMYVSKEYEQVIRDAYSEHNLDVKYLEDALMDSGNIKSTSFEFSITSALSRLNMKREILAESFEMTVDDFNMHIKNYDALTFSQIIKLSKLLNCSPKELIFRNETKIASRETVDSITKYFNELWFSVSWVVNIFCEKINYYRENVDFFTNNQKKLFVSAAHYYSLILISELWNSSTNEGDDITFGGFFKKSSDTLDPEINLKLNLIKNRFFSFKKDNNLLIKRFKLSRDKIMVHLTNYKRNIITIKDSNGMSIIMYETEFTKSELTLVINELVDLTNNISSILNGISSTKFDSIDLFVPEI